MIWGTGKPGTAHSISAAWWKPGCCTPGQPLYFQKEASQAAHIRADGRLVLENGQQGTIHTLARRLMGGSPGNGWQLWYYEDAGGELQRSMGCARPTGRCCGLKSKTPRNINKISKGVV